MLFTKLNFAIQALVAGDKYGACEVVHVTHKFTEVTNGRFVVRVSTPENGKDVEVPKRRGYTPSGRKKLDVCIWNESAKAVEQTFPKVRYSMGLAHATMTWMGKNSDGGAVEFLMNDGSDFRSVNATVAEKKFPDTDRLIRTIRRRPKATVFFSAKMLGKLLSFLASREVSPVKFEVWGQDDPARLTAVTEDGNNKVLIIAAPMKNMERPKVPVDKKEEEGGPGKEEPPITVDKQKTP